MNDGQSAPSSRDANRLSECTSPYLLQHAHNPVDWYPWGSEALERARREDKPILLSIGYSACHWCHVMAHESFEDPEIARRMNENFVNIKVDREERPDLDSLYMQAVQILTGSGGWPLTVFLTPDLVPFFGGTYFPPEPRGGMAGFPQLLELVRRVYDEKREDVESSAESIAQAVRGLAGGPVADEGPSRAFLQEAMRGLEREFDHEQGGFGGSPKFPQAPAFDFMLRLWGDAHDDDLNGMLALTLDQMADGGIRDQIGGGFHRYAVDSMWRVPHFEKMLYDNAQLSALYADAAVAFGRPDYAEIAASTCDYVIRDLRSPEGGFYSAQDADSEGGEGRFYTWSYDQIAECVDESALELVTRYFGVCEEGNWEDGLNVLHRPVRLAELAGLLELDEPEARRMMDAAVDAMLARREQRPRPATDTKVLADWNGLMIGGLVRTYRATRREEYLRAAQDCAGFVLDTMWPEDGLLHNWCDGRGGEPAFLADCALLADGLLTLYGSTFKPAYLERARQLADTMLAEFWNEDIASFTEAGERTEDLFAPVRSATDQPLPAGNSAACHVLLQLSEICGESCYAETVETALRGVMPMARTAPVGFGTALSAMLRRLSEPREFVIVGDDGEGFESLVAAADACYLPNMVRAGARDPDVRGTEVALLEGKRAQDGAVAYVCSGGTCREPVSDPDELRAQLEALA